MHMYTRQKDQGQMVEISYGISGDYAYRKHFDRSNRTEKWFVGEIDWDKQPEYEDHNTAPAVFEWKVCKEP